MSFELKNIPISISILHEQEHHNLCKMIYRIQNQRRRRAYTEIQKSSESPTSNQLFNLRKRESSFLQLQKV